MILSLIVPGFGQFYNGQFVKACVCLGVLSSRCFLISLTPDIKAIRCLLAPATTSGCRGLTIAPLTWFCMFAAGAAWLFSLVDAPSPPQKPSTCPATPVPVVDKTAGKCESAATDTRVVAVAADMLYDR
jgi:hypothetical protein